MVLVLPCDVKASPSAASTPDSGWGSRTGCAASFANIGVVSSLVSSPKSTGRLQNGHGARFVGGFVRHTSVMHLRQKLWLHFVHARSMYGPRQIEHWTSDCCRWGRGGPSGSGRACAPTGDFRYIYPLWTKPILHNNSNAWKRSPPMSQPRHSPRHASCQRPQYSSHLVWLVKSGRQSPVSFASLHRRICSSSSFPPNEPCVPPSEGSCG